MDYMHLLTEAEATFIENQGLFFERFGLPRIGGRVLALLLLAEAPVTLDEVGATLKVGKASASTNLRHLVTMGVVDVVTPLGDRKTYYQWSPRAWERRYDLVAIIAAAARNTAEQGLAAIGPECVEARSRMEEAIAFADYMAEALVGARQGWLERLAKIRGEKA